MSVQEREWALHRVDLPMEPWLVMLLFLQAGFIFEPDIIIPRQGKPYLNRVEYHVIERNCYTFENAYLISTECSEEQHPKLIYETLGYKVWNGVAGKTHSLHKRGILELAGTIKCGTGRIPLAYLGYGCYCGLGGHGWPKDKTDWCCQRHDCCYGFAEEQGCNPKATRYRWSCKHNTVVCGTVLDRCQQIVCQCDKEVSKCLRSAVFNPRYILWPNFLCGQTHPMCTYNVNENSKRC